MFTYALLVFLVSFVIPLGLSPKKRKEYFASVRLVLGFIGLVVVLLLTLTIFL